ncbi:uncharacterized protein [Parasteatoda tepidariorum]|uniref:uncharacterized protein n=1 Tax=Parasteatoda tepidariorum TaxID=114398 RepID=UPI001C71D8DF|nr:uncharacterized protein LOC107451923 isoform X1 [Parasteatoda tepidariorum]
MPVMPNFRDHFLPTFAQRGVPKMFLPTRRGIPRKKDRFPRKEENNPKAIDQTPNEAECGAHEEKEDLQNMPFQKRVPHDRDRSKNTARNMVTSEDWWTSTKRSKDSYSLVDPNKLKLTKPDDVDSIKLGRGRSLRSSSGSETDSSSGSSSTERAAAENTEISEDGLMSSIKNENSYRNVDPNKLKLTKPSDVESIKPGPERAMQSLGGDETGGSAGPSKPEKAADQKSELSEVDGISSTKSKSGNDDPNTLKLTMQLSTATSNTPHDTNTQAAAAQPEKYPNSGGMPTAQQHYQWMSGPTYNPQPATLGYYTARSSVPRTIPNMGMTPLQIVVNQAGQQPTSHYGQIQMLPPFSHPMQPVIVNPQFQQMVHTSLLLIIIFYLHILFGIP